MVFSRSYFDRRPRLEFGVPKERDSGVLADPGDEAVDRGPPGRRLGRSRWGKLCRTRAARTTPQGRQRGAGRSADCGKPVDELCVTRFIIHKILHPRKTLQLKPNALRRNMNLRVLILRGGERVDRKALSGRTVRRAARSSGLGAQRAQAFEAERDIGWQSLRAALFGRTQGSKADWFERRQECSSEHVVLGPASAHLAPLFMRALGGPAQGIAAAGKTTTTTKGPARNYRAGPRSSGVSLDPRP